MNWALRRVVESDRRTRWHRCPVCRRAVKVPWVALHAEPHATLAAVASVCLSMRAPENGEAPWYRHRRVLSEASEG